jgi:hypothetical protein
MIDVSYAFENVNVHIWDDNDPDETYVRVFTPGDLHNQFVNSVEWKDDNDHASATKEGLKNALRHVWFMTEQQKKDLWKTYLVGRLEVSEDLSDGYDDEDDDDDDDWED